MTKFISVEEKEKDAKTVFIHFLSPNEGWRATTKQPLEFDKVLHLGNSPTDGDVFAAYFKNRISIYRGTKGTEFNK